MGPDSAASRQSRTPKTISIAAYNYVFGVSDGKPDICTEMVEVTTELRPKSKGTSDGKPSKETQDRVFGSTKAPATAVGGAVPSDQPTVHSRVVPAT